MSSSNDTVTLYNNAIFSFHSFILQLDRHNDSMLILLDRFIRYMENHGSSWIHNTKDKEYRKAIAVTGRERRCRFFWVCRH